MWSIETVFACRLREGDALESIENAFRPYLGRMKELKRLQTFHFSSLRRQACLNLMGRGNDDVVDLAVPTINAEMLSKDGTLRGSFRAFQGFLLTHMGKHQQHAKFTIENGWDSSAKDFPGTILNPMDIFTKGLSCLAAARETKNRTFEKAGRACRSRIKLWAKRGHPNSLHYEFALDAEFEALKGRNQSARKNYEIAIGLALGSGVLQDVGLLSERKCCFGRKSHLFKNSKLLNFVFSCSSPQFIFEG